VSDKSIEEFNAFFGIGAAFLGKKGPEDWTCNTLMHDRSDEEINGKAT
jgi:hypothetical protein